MNKDENNLYVVTSPLFALLDLLITVRLRLLQKDHNIFRMRISLGRERCLRSEYNAPNGWNVSKSKRGCLTLHVFIERERERELPSLRNRLRKLRSRRLNLTFQTMRIRTIVLLFTRQTANSLIHNETHFRISTRILVLNARFYDFFFQRAYSENIHSVQNIEKCRVI